MSQLNRPGVYSGLRTFQGAIAHTPSPEAELRRAVACCLLWEDSFYENGEAIADRIRSLIAHPQMPADFVMSLARTARSEYKLRHVPLLLVRELLRHPGSKPGLAQCIADVIQRPDELAELCALYWSDAKSPTGKRRMLPRQLKRGLALAFQKFSAYSLAKYNRDNAVRLRDVLFMCHGKPKRIDDTTPGQKVPPINKPTYKRGPVNRHVSGQGGEWRGLVEGSLPPPDTWEVALSSGADKRATFERLLREESLGALALLRNLRNMEQSGVNRELIIQALAKMDVSRVLPYRFLAAAAAAPSFEPQLDRAMLSALQSLEKLPGETLILVDHSGSMNDPLSAKSDLTRFEAACGLAILIQGIAERCRVFAFSSSLCEVPARPGMALRDALHSSMPFGGTWLGKAVSILNQLTHSRLIVVTDEQSSDPVPAPHALGYMLNVAGYRPEVGWGDWTRISGWSEGSIRFIQEIERGALT